MLYRNALCALALLSFSGYATAVEIGFNGLVTATVSDNVDGGNVGTEVEGNSGFAQFGVFGEQKGTNLRGAFTGELYSTRQLDDPDAETVVISQFLGAAEWDVTPRSFTWYVGDILGGIRADDALLADEDQNKSQRRNVFVTGPQFVYELDSFSRVNARILYVNQTQNELDLESLYSANASWEVATDSGNTWGFVFSDLYTDSPELELENNADRQEGDFNRFSLSGTWRRERGAFSFGAELGGTRYDTEIESLDGVNVRLSFVRQLGPATSISIGLTRDLQDQTLNTLETLIADGTGVEIDGDGFFDETRLDASYSFTSPATFISASIGASQADFRLLADNVSGLDLGADTEDRNNVYASINYTRTFTTKTSFNSTLSYEMQSYINQVNESESVLGSLQLNHQLSRSFTVQIGYRGSLSEGERDLVVGNVLEAKEFIDVKENRIVLGILWAPPTRASQDLTVELKSLLQQ